MIVVRSVVAFVAPLLAGCAPFPSPQQSSAAAEWSIAEVRNDPDHPTIIRFAEGREFTTTLYGVVYLGEILVPGRAPYLVLAGRGCTECDANLAIYVHSPDDGEMRDEAEQPRYSYPGTTIEWEPETPGDTIADRSRFFLGSCVPSLDAAAVWFLEERTAPAELSPRILFLQMDQGRLQEAEVLLPIWTDNPRFLNLDDEALLNVRRGRCREIPPMNQLREP
jgi:hypothetical protein